MTKKKMVIFASGRGSNAIALHDAVEAGTINAEIKALVCDIPGAPVMDRAKGMGRTGHFGRPQILRLESGL